MMKRIQVIAGALFIFLPMVSIQAQSKKPPSQVTGIEKETGHRSVAQPQKWQSVIPEGVSLDDGLSEDEAVAIALWNNAQLHADLSAIGLARADLIDAGLLSNPILSFVLPVGPYRQFEAPLNFPLDFFWQRRRRVEAASIELDRVAKGLEQNALNLMRDVRTAFVEVKLAEHRAELAEESVRLRGQIVRLTNIRLRVGDVSDIEATAARLDESLALEISERTRRDVGLAFDRLRNLMGVTGETKFSLDEPKDEAEAIPASLKPDDPAAMDELMTVAFASRPDLRAAELAIEVAARRAKWQRSRIGALAALLNFKQGAGVPFAVRPGALIDLPVFNRNQGGIARADAEVERAAWQYLSVRQRIAGEVREALDRYFQARKSLNIWRSEIMPQTADNARLSENAFKRGDQSYLFVLDAMRRVVDAGVREAELKTDLRRAAAQLDRAVGQKSWRNMNAKP